MTIRRQSKERLISVAVGAAVTAVTIVGLGYFILEVRVLLRVVGFVMRPETLLAIAVLGFLAFGLFGMGAWLRAATETGDGFWFRWWILMGVIFGNGLFGEYLDETTRAVLAAGIWIVFVVVGIRTILQRRSGDARTERR